MAKQKRKQRISTHEKKRREKIRRSLKRYHNDVRAVKKATGATWREAQRLIPADIRRPAGRGALRRGDLLDLAKERYAVSRETEYVPPPPQVEPAAAPPPPEDSGIEGKSVEITYVDLLEYLIEAARRGDTVEFGAAFYQAEPEKMEPGPRASEISRAFGAAGDRANTNDKSRYWRIRQVFTITFGKGGWVLL